jgi:hypothetical protein
MPKFFFVRYQDNSWLVVWSFRYLTPADICERCTEVYLVYPWEGFWEIIKYHWINWFKYGFFESMYIK